MLNGVDFRENTPWSFCPVQFQLSMQFSSTGSFGVKVFNCALVAVEASVFICASVGVDTSVFSRVLVGEFTLILLLVLAVFRTLVLPSW